MHLATQDQPLRVLVAPDSFKGSLAASDVARHIAAGLAQALPGCIVTQAPIADGGEGTAAAVAQQLGGAWRELSVASANGTPVTLPYAVCHSPALGRFAIFDVAEIVGLPDAVIPAGERTTRGVGQALSQLASLGFETIVVGLGGSSTNEGGAGMLSEVLFDFRDADGAPVDPVLDTLDAIDHVQRRADSVALAGVTLIGLTDVSSPLTGLMGASHVFGAQKGVPDLHAADRAIAGFAEEITALTGIDHRAIDGAGAAGGLGFALRTLGATLQPGAQFILQALGLDQGGMEFDWVITGEGRSDGQTLLGKGPATIASLARRHGIPVTLLSGAIEDNPDLYAAFDGCFSVQAAPVALDYALEHAGALLEAAACNLGRLYGAVLHRV
jgi:glycerate kinase